MIIEFKQKSDFKMSSNTSSNLSSETTTSTFLGPYPNPSSTTITTTEYGSTFEIIYPCTATTTGVCLKEVKSSGSSPAKGGILKFFVFVMMLVSTVFGEYVNGVQLINATSLGAAIDQITETVAAGANGDAFIVSVEGQLTGISNFTIEQPSNVTKRWDASNAPLGASWTQHQVANHGTWWSQWYPASCVHQNGDSSEPTTVSVEESTSYSASWSDGFDVSFGESFSANIGITITTTNLITITQTYTIPAHDYGQVWQQQLMVWQDQQKQHCHKYNYGKNGIKCGAWSAYIRGNFPVKNGQSFGWSTGWNNMDFSSCGGGK